MGPAEGENEMTNYETDEERSQIRGWAMALIAVAAWLFLAANSADAQTMQVPDFVLAQAFGAVPEAAMPASGPGVKEARGPESMANVDLVANDIRARFEDQLIAGVSQPSVELLVRFEFDSDEIDSESHTQIEAAATVLNRDFPSIRFRVAGFTDTAGDALYNRDLSERRAAAVWQELVEGHGVSADRLERVGYGEDDPSVGADDAQRRRVELQILRGDRRSL